LKEKLISEYKRLVTNKEKLQFFEKTNMYIFRFTTEENFKIENIFKSLSPVNSERGELGNKERYEST